jgi:hypothetical protein
MNTGPGLLLTQVRTSNAQARDARDRWAPHRAEVMRILRELPLAGARLALLGAGHLHDVEFGELLRGPAAAQCRNGPGDLASKSSVDAAASLAFLCDSSSIRRLQHADRAWHRQSNGSARMSG